MLALAALCLAGWSPTPFAQQPVVPVHLEMRAVAVGGENYDAKAAQRRLNAWLDAEGHRELVRRSPLAIHLFNRTPPTSGGPTAGLAWCSRVVGAHDGRWGFSYARENVAVPVFSPDEYRRGPTDQMDILVELLPVEQAGLHFTGHDLDRIGLGVGHGDRPVVEFLIRPEKASSFADWTEYLMGRNVAVIVEGLVVSAPKIMARIPGLGEIRFDAEGADAVAERGRPNLVRELDSASSWSLLAVPLRAMGDNRRDASSDGWPLLFHPDAVTRARTAVELRRVEKDPGPTARVLIAALLKERDVRVLRELVTSLGTLGAAARAAVPELEVLSGHDDAQIAMRAKAALRQIRGGD